MIHHYMNSKDVLMNKCSKCNSSIMQKAINFSGALARHVADGLVYTPEEVREERLNICRQCPYRDPNSHVMICTHKDCGCYLDSKVAWASETCPDGLWGKYTEDKNLDKDNNESTPQS